MRDSFAALLHMEDVQQVTDRWQERINVLVHWARRARDVAMRAFGLPLPSVVGGETTTRAEIAISHPVKPAPALFASTAAAAAAEPPAAASRGAAAASPAAAAARLTASAKSLTEVKGRMGGGSGAAGGAARPAVGGQGAVDLRESTRDHEAVEELASLVHLSATKFESFVPPGESVM